MLVITRYVVPLEEQEAFHDEARLALRTLELQTGWRSGRIARTIDDPTLWVLATEWDSVGDYRRALSAHDTKVAAWPTLGRAIDEPTAYEVFDARGKGSRGLAGPSMLHVEPDTMPPAADAGTTG